jgi:hypothetical protein
LQFKTKTIPPIAEELSAQADELQGVIAILIDIREALLIARLRRP